MHTVPKALRKQSRLFFFSAGLALLSCASLAQAQVLIVSTYEMPDSKLEQYLVLARD